MGKIKPSELKNEIERLGVTTQERASFITLLARQKFKDGRSAQPQRTVQEFNKYKELGPYHWDGLKKTIRGYNAPLAARYALSEGMIKKNCRNPGRIVDVGCGDGVFTKRLAEIYMDSEVIGFDFDETAIDNAVKKTEKLGLSNLSFVNGDVFKHVTEADLIVATDVIEHLNKPDVFLATCHDTLTSGGKLFISTPIRYREHSTDPYHVREFFYDELEALSRFFDFSVLDHTRSHEFKYNERYNLKFRLAGIGKERYYYKFFYNLLAIHRGRNIFEAQQCSLPIMQYILLGKP